MPRLKNRDDIVVNVSDETAEVLGSEWTDAESATKRSPGRPKKSE